MRFTNHTLFVVLSCLLAGVSSTAHAGWLGRNSSNNDPANQGARQTQEFVDARMHETLSSIDRHLDMLVSMNRAGEAPRKPGIIGPTVAGASGPALPVVNPLPAYPQAQGMDPAILSRRVKIQWNGSAAELLSSMSSQLGFHFINNAKIEGRVRLDGENLTVEQTLNLIAKQMRGQSDIIVSLPKRTITLMPK